MAINIGLYFDCASKKTYVKDTTNYNTEVPLGVSVIGLGDLMGPGNTLVFSKLSIGTPLIAVDADPRVSDLYNLPTLVGGTGVVPGAYTLNYSNYYSFVNNNNPGSQYITFLSTNELLIPAVDLTSIWAVGDTFTLASCTEISNDGTYTIQAIELTGSSTKITVSGTPFTISEGGDTTAVFTTNKEIAVVINKVYTYTACATTVNPCVSANYDCTSTPFGNITFENSTTLPTGVVIDSSVFTIYYPNGLDFTQSPNPGYNDENPVIANDVNSVYISTLATGTWSAKLALNTSQTQTDGLVLTNSSSVVKEFNVSCTSNMCGLSSCLTKLKDRHISYLRSSTVSPLQQYVDNVQLLYTMAREAQACGDKNAYERYISEIFEVVRQTDTSCGCGCSGSCSGSCSCGGCDDGCGCGETGPTWVNNTGVDIASLLEDLEGIPAQVEALQGSVDSLTENVNLLNEWTGIENFDPENPNLYTIVSNLETGLGTVEGQVDVNSGDIIALQDQVNTLESEVAALQDEIANFSPSDSEISTYELMTNDGSKKCVWQASLGTANDSTEYSIVISGDVTTFLNASQISFYNPTTQSWFYGLVSNASYSGGSNSTTLTVQFSSSTYSNGCSWQDSDVSFPVYKGNLTTSNYNLTTSLLLDNDNYWKFEDLDYKYWSKINASFIINEPSANSTGLIDPFIIRNVTANKSITLRDLPCGSFVDLELSFEKQYDGEAYDCVIVIDIKYNTSTNSALSDTSELLFGGYSGFNPKYGYGLDLKHSAGTLELSIASNESVSSTQDVYNSVDGTQNTNRIISRQASGPNYAGTPTFFSGDELESILFNETNINITLLNIEQSFGKMPVA
jgi:hypothetical protein